MTEQACKGLLVNASNNLCVANSRECIPPLFYYDFTIFLKCIAQLISPLVSLFFNRFPPSRQKEVSRREIFLIQCK